jgi:hypothetical protein
LDDELFLKFFYLLLSKMSGYQVSNTNFFASQNFANTTNAQISLLQEEFYAPTREIVTTGASGILFTADQIVSGYIVLTGSFIGGTYTTPTAAEIIAAFEAEVAAQHGVTIPPTPISGQAIGSSAWGNTIRDGFHKTLIIRNNTAATAISLSAGTNVLVQPAAIITAAAEVSVIDVVVTVADSVSPQVVFAARTTA